MKHYSIRAAVILALAAASVSCDKIKPPQPQLQPAPTTTEQPRQPDAGQAQARNEFTQASQKTLDELRDAIARVKTKAEAANVETKARLGEEITKLEAELQEVQRRLTELKSATIESWGQMKDTFSDSLEKLKNAVTLHEKNAG